MITKPTLLIDQQKCVKNIKEMCLTAELSNADFRPHFKTHQSIEIGNWFRKLGVDKIAVSSLSMAEYFSNHWSDITVAFPVNILEIDTINSLAKKIQLNLLVESTETIKYLDEYLQSFVDIFIKIDVGYNRTGITPNNIKKIDEIISIIEDSNKLSFKGFLSHAGHTYNCRSQNEIIEIHQNSIEQLKPLVSHYRAKFPNFIMSYGDTPSCSVAEDFTIFDEIRPGNFVFYDLSQQQIGACGLNDIAVALACPIVSIHKDRNELVIYGGGVHFSKETLEIEKDVTIYGIVVEEKDSGWGNPIPHMFVKNLSQEHGIVSLSKDRISDYKVGDILYILPIHSCMTANLMKDFNESKVV